MSKFYRTHHFSSGFWLIPTYRESSFNIHSIKNILENKFGKEGFDFKIDGLFLNIKFLNKHKFSKNYMDFHLDQCEILKPKNIIQEINYLNNLCCQLNDEEYEDAEEERKLFEILLEEDIPYYDSLSGFMTEIELFQPIFIYLYEYFQCYLIDSINFPNFISFIPGYFSEDEKIIYQEPAVLVL